MYKQSVILFGIVLPLVICLMISGAGYVSRSKVVDSYNRKARNYKTYQTSKITAHETEMQIGRQREVYQQWCGILEQESFGVMTSNMKSIAEKLPSKEFQLTSSERLNNKSGLGSATVQKSSSVKFTLRGTFRTVQKALLELETRMPNLQLQDLKMDPNSSSGTPVLNFQVVYVAWEK